MKKINFKKQIIGILTESFYNNDKNKIKKLIKLITEDDKLKDLYLFYEEIEKKYFEDKDIATEYVEKLSEQLKGKDSIFSNKKTYDLLNEEIDDCEILNEELYSHLDTLLENDNIRNIDRKIMSKNFLVNYLTTKHELEENDNIEETINENLLNTVLVSNFNSYYDTLLSEEEKNTLKNILNISDDEIKIKFTEIKEEVSTKLNKLINESDGELREKLKLTKNELYSMEKSKINYYKLNQLKNGL